MAEQENDFGFTTVQPTNIAKLQKDASFGIEAAKHYQQQLEKMKNKILPLLLNLQKDPDKDIHWPNRHERIDRFINEINDIVDKDPYKGKL